MSRLESLPFAAFLLACILLPAAAVPQEVPASQEIAAKPLTKKENKKRQQQLTKELGSDDSDWLRNVVPDIITLAKGINSGYVPLGAMVVRPQLADWIRPRFFAGGLTYSGHPLACASAVASIEAFQEEGIVENSAGMGTVFQSELARLAEKHPSIGEVRGLGCFWGLELVKNRETREPLVPFNGSGEAAKPVVAMAKHALGKGLYLMTHWNVVMVVPPLTVTREEAEEGAAILDDVLSIADEYYEG